MPPVPSSTGLGKPRGARRTGRRRKPKQTGSSRMKQVALSLKDTKKHSTHVSNFTLWAGAPSTGGSAQPFVVIKPLSALAMSATNSETARESNMIYAMNCRLDLNITTNPLTLNPYHIRIIKGWAKGNASYGASARSPNDQISEAQLAIDIPNHFTEIDSDDFKILMDRSYTLSPKQVYDAYPGSQASTDNRALWSDFTFKHNWKFDRKYKFEDSTGASLVGWHPFIAIQLDRSIYGPQFTGTEGACPSPTVQYQFDTYFKDIN